MSGATTSSLIARVLAQRDSWLTLREAAEGKPALRVQLRRPPEGEFHRFSGRPGVSRSQQMAELVPAYTVGWEGFTEAELLGPAVGASSPVPFDAELWAVVLLDNLEWLGACANHLTGLVSQYLAARETATKN